MIETWGFSEVIKDIGTDDNDANNPDNNNNDNDGNNDKASQLWDLIETWGFREDIKEVKGINNRDLKSPIIET